MSNLRSIVPIILGLAFSQIAGSSQTPAFVQQNYKAPQSAQSTVTVAYPAAQSAGNANIVVIGWNDTFASISSVSDSAGNNYQLAVATFQANGMSQAIYFAPGIRAGANTVSAEFNQPAGFVDLRITEYSGLSPSLDAFQAGASAAGVSSNADSGPVSISTTNSLIFAAGMTGTSFISSSGGFTLRVITSPDGDIVEDQIAGTAGLYPGLATVEPGPWLMQVAAFKPATPAGPPGLSIAVTGSNLLVSWPTQPGYNLQSNQQLGTSNWANVTNSVTTAGGQSQVRIPLTGPRTFYRLKSSGG